MSGGRIEPDVWGYVEIHVRRPIGPAPGSSSGRCPGSSHMLLEGLAKRDGADGGIGLLGRLAPDRNVRRQARAAKRDKERHAPGAHAFSSKDDYSCSALNLRNLHRNLMPDSIGLDDAVDDGLVVDNLAGGYGGCAAGLHSCHEGAELLVEQVAAGI